MGATAWRLGEWAWRVFCAALVAAIVAAAIYATLYGEYNRRTYADREATAIALCNTRGLAMIRLTDGRMVCGVTP